MKLMLEDAELLPYVGICICISILKPGWQPLTSAAIVAEASSPKRLFSVVVGKRKETTFHFDAHRQMDSFLLKAVVRKKK